MITRETAPNGTVVFLNSGSPELTVDWTLRSDNLVCVQWFAEGGELKTDAFRPECLTLNAPKPKGGE